MDIRVQRTRARFRQALRELISEKDYYQISVKDLAERAQAARLTFYRNYDSCEDLLGDCIDEIQSELFEQLGAVDLERYAWHDPIDSIALKLYHWVEANQELLHALINSRVASLLLRSARKRLAAMIIDHINTQRQEISIPLEIFAQYYANTVTGLIIWWLESDQSYSVEYLADCVNWLTVGGPILNQPPPQPGG